MSTCKDTRLLLEEVVGLSSKLNLEVHELTDNDNLAREARIDRIPALRISSDVVKGTLRYFGLPSGYEFSVLIGSVLDVSQAQQDLAEETLEVLNALDKVLHIQVFVTPT